MTREGLQALEQELRRLKSEERPAVIKAIAEAREHGDLSENAEYHAAREKQGFIEGRIAELEDVTSRAEAIDTANMSGDTVKFGAFVLVADADTDEDGARRELLWETDDGQVFDRRVRDAGGCRSEIAADGQSARAV